MLKINSRTPRWKIKREQERQGKKVQARAKKRIQRLKKRLEADGVAEALRSFVRAAIAQAQEGPKE